MSAQEIASDRVCAESREAVNMAPAALRHWLDTDDSNVGVWRW
jgi:hypothetical protein